MNKLVALVVGAGLLIGAYIYMVSRYLPINNQLQKADAIVAISGGDTAGRTQHAIELYKAGWAPKVIFSGAAKDPDSPSNASVMKGQALQAGVPLTAIVTEEKGRDTKGNAEATRMLTESYTHIILVTSDYHQRRAYKEFRSVYPSTIQILNSPANDKNWGQKSWFLTPYGWWISITEPIKLLV